MDRTTTGTQDWTITEGTDVVGSDGEKVGEVVAVQSNYVVVEKGFFFPTDYYIPTSAISNYDGDKIYLNVSKDEALNQGWDTEPVATTTTDTYVEPATTDTYTDRTAVDTTRTVSESDTLRVPVQEEELTATRREVDRGAVRVEKDVVAEEQTLEVPVTEERVNVQRRAVDRAVTDADATFEEGAIEVPVRGEEVVAEKRARVTEEVEISKEPVARTERVSGTVRREEVRVDDATTNVTDADRATTNVTDADRTDRGRI